MKIAVAVFLLIPVTASAATLCGTVRDALTSEPVSRAGIFLRTPEGAYTGMYGATDTEGAFCIGNVPPGVYDLEVRVDNYQLTYVLGVEVTDDTNSVDIDLIAGRFHFAPPCPNPAREQVVFQVRIAEPAFARLMILDIHGHLIRGWGGYWGSSGEHLVEWDLSNTRGQSVASGMYIARLVIDGRTQVRSVMVLD